MSQFGYNASSSLGSVDRVSPVLSPPVLYVCVGRVCACVRVSTGNVPFSSRKPAEPYETIKQHAHSALFALLYCSVPRALACAALALPCVLLYSIR